MTLDFLGLIVTKSGDGGDTAQNEGMYAIANQHDPVPYLSAIGLLEPKKDGIWVRHPIQYPDTKDFSRDQAISNIIALGMYNQTDRLGRMFKAQLKRGMLYQNHDIPAPDNIGQFIRAFQTKWLYPILWFTDIFLLINVLIVCLIKARTPGKIQRWLGKHVSYLFIQGEPNNSQGIPQDIYGWTNVGTDKNLIASLYQAQQIMATPISLLSRVAYKHLRPGGVYYPLKVYYNTDNYDIAEAWTTLLGNFL